MAADEGSPELRVAGVFLVVMEDEGKRCFVHGRAPGAQLGEFCEGALREFVAACDAQPIGGVQ